jgi:aerobic-type carbon monoxide dehydrogenase small subunit (CoxS/CutS family)
MPGPVNIELYVNGVARQLRVPDEKPLLAVLREDLSLTGSKIGCGEGECGACTVLVDDMPVRACITPVRTAAGKTVLTIEGLEQDGRLHPVQQAFLDEDALQCGYCTPGMIMSGVGLLRQNPNPTPGQIVTFMQGNLCRGGTYRRIVRAIRRAAAAGGAL